MIVVSEFALTLNVNKVPIISIILKVKGTVPPVMLY
jgi:hypothetical protein